MSSPEDFSQSHVIICSPQPSPIAAKRHVLRSVTAKPILAIVTKQRRGYRRQRIDRAKALFILKSFKRRATTALYPTTRHPTPHRNCNLSSCRFWRRGTSLPKPQCFISYTKHGPSRYTIPLQPISIPNNPQYPSATSPAPSNITPASQLPQPHPAFPNLSGTH